MTVTDIRQTVIQVINQVQRLIGVNPTSTLTETKGATLYLRLLNEIVAECADAGNWLELYKTHTVTAQSSVSQYTIDASALVHHVYEIRWHTDHSPLEVKDIQTINRLLAKPSYGTPRQFALTGVDTTGQPKFSVYQVPTTARTFTVYFYEKPPLYTTSDSAVVLDLPANLMIAGLHAKVLLEENGGEPTRQWEAAYKNYLSLRGQALNRWNSDTGTDVYFRPMMGRVG